MCLCVCCMSFDVFGSKNIPVLIWRSLTLVSSLCSSVSTHDSRDFRFGCRSGTVRANDEYRLSRQPVGQRLCHRFGSGPRSNDFRFGQRICASVVCGHTLPRLPSSRAHEWTGGATDMTANPVTSNVAHFVDPTGVWTSTSLGSSQYFSAQRWATRQSY